MSFCRNLLPADISCMVHPEVHRAYRNCVVMYLNYTSGTETCAAYVGERYSCKVLRTSDTIEIQEYNSRTEKLDFLSLKLFFPTRVHSGTYMLYFKDKTFVDFSGNNNMGINCHYLQVRKIYFYNIQIGRAHV